MAGHCVYAISHLTGKMNMIDLQTMEQQEFEMPFVFAEMPDIEDKNVLLESEKYIDFAWETAYLNLDMLIDIAKKSVVKKQDKENCGETIYQYIKGLVP